MRRFSPVIVLLPAIIGLGSACYEDSSLNPHAAQVQARVFLAGAPLPYGLIGNVEVYVVEIAASTEADTQPDTDSWSSLAVPSRRFDLQQMSHGRTVMVGEVTLPVDQYRAIAHGVEIVAGAAGALPVGILFRSSRVFGGGMLSLQQVKQGDWFQRWWGVPEVLPPNALRSQSATTSMRLSCLALPCPAMSRLESAHFWPI